MSGWPLETNLPQRLQKDLVEMQKMVKMQRHVPRKSDDLPAQIQTNLPQRLQKDLVKLQKWQLNNK